MLALFSAVSESQDNGVRALRLSLKSGRDRRVCTVERPAFVPSVGDELPDNTTGECWTVTKLEWTQILARIPFPPRPATPVQGETDKTEEAT